MYDTFSDFEHIASNGNNPESETDMQLLAESQTLLLREQNEALSKENASLRAQFEEALKITKQVEDVHQKNRQLKTAIREYQGQIDNMSQRMDISSRTIEELNQKVETEKMNASAVHDNEQALLQKEIKKIKTQTKAQVDNLYGQLDQLNKAKEKIDLDQKMINGKIDRCIDNAQHFFQVDFRSFDDLISFLSQTHMISSAQQQENQVKSQQQQPQQQQQQQQLLMSSEKDLYNKHFQKLGKKLKRERAKNKEHLLIHEELESVVGKLKRDQQDLEKKHQQEIESLKRAIEQKEEDFNNQDSDQKHQIANLKAKICSLKENIKKRTAENSQMYQQQPLYSQQQPLQLFPQQQTIQSNCEAPKNDKCQEYDIAVEQMAQRNAELSAQLRTAVAKREEMTTKARSLETQKHEQDIVLEKCKNELNALSIVHKETVAELESVRNALHEREVGADKKEKTKLKRELQTIKSQYNNLQSSLESQKKQTYELTLTNEQNLNTINQLKEKIAESRKVIEEDQHTIESLKDDLTNVQHAIEDKQTLTPEDIMPPSVWRFPEFGSELCDLICKVSMNPALQPASKLQSIYKTIHQHYGKIISERDAALEDAYSNNQACSHALNQFLINISISLGIEPVTYEDFFTRNGPNVIIGKIDKIRECHDDYKRTNEQLNAVLNHLYQTLNMTPDSDVGVIIEQTNRVRDQLNMQTALLQKRSKKCHDISAAFKLLKRKYDSDVEDLSNQIELLTGQVEKVTKINNDLSSSNQQVKRELQSLKVEYRDYKEKAEEKENTLTEKHEEKAQAWNQERSQLISQLQGAFKQHEEKISSVSGSIAENESVIEKLKKTIQAQKSSIIEKDCELTRIKQSTEETIQEITSKVDKEKKQLVQSYEKAVEEITQQCNMHRSDVEKLSKALAESEKKFKQAKTTVLQIKRENVKFASELQAQKEQFDREKKLAESATKNAVLNAETNFNSKLDEQKSKFETEKRRTYAYVADTFKQFFNPHENIDERSFKQILNRSKDELAKLISTDLAIRRLVGAATHQKTDDAVAQVLMGSA